MRGGSLSAAAMALAASVVVWHFGSPRWTLDQMRAAAAARDATALAEYVDFEALRDSVGAEVAGVAPVGARADGGVGAALGMALLDPMLDPLASPWAVETLAADGAGATADPGAIAIERQGLSTFRVVGGDGAVALVFRRRGYAWRLAAIDQPPAGVAAGR